MSLGPQIELLSGRTSPSLSTNPATPATGAQTPDPLLGQSAKNHIVDADTLAQSVSRMQQPANESYELEHRRRRQSHAVEFTETNTATATGAEQANEAGTPSPPSGSQGVPPELRNFTSEIVLVMVCSAGLMFFSFLLGDILVVQQQFRSALGIKNTELPWLVGAFNVANGLSVVVSGSLTDLTPPKLLMVGAFA